MPDCEVCGHTIPDGTSYVSIDRITERRHGDVSTPSEAQPLLVVCKRHAPTDRQAAKALWRAPCWVGR